MKSDEKQVIKNLMMAMKEYDDGAYYLALANSIKRIGYLKSENAIFMKRFHDVYVPLRYNKNGYFEEQLTGENLMVAVPFKGLDDNFDNVMISNGSLLSSSGVNVEKFDGFSNGLYLDGEVLEVPFSMAISSFMESVFDDNEARDIIKDMLVSSYVSRKMIGEISKDENFNDRLEDIRKGALALFEKEKDDAFVSNDHFKNDEVLEEESFMDDECEMERLLDYDYLYYKLVKNNFKNRTIRKFRYFKDSIANVFKKHIRLHKKISSASHSSGRRFVLKKSKNRGKHAA